MIEWIYFFRPTPCCITLLNDKRVIKVVSGAQHCVALTADSKVYCWGDNQLGQLGFNEDLSLNPRILSTGELRFLIKFIHFWAIFIQLFDHDPLITISNKEKIQILPEVSSCFLIVHVSDSLLCPEDIFSEKLILSQ